MSKFRSRSSAHPTHLQPWAARRGEAGGGQDAFHIFSADLWLLGSGKWWWRSRPRGQDPVVLQLQLPAGNLAAVAACHALTILIKDV